MRRHMVEHIVQQGFVIRDHLGPIEGPAVRCRPSAWRWSTDALTAFKTAASRMCSLVGFPHFWQALWAGDQLPLPCPRCGDGGAVR